MRKALRLCRLALRRRVRPIRNRVYRRFGWYIPPSKGARAACRVLSANMGGIAWERDSGQYDDRP